MFYMLLPEPLVITKGWAGLTNTQTVLFDFSKRSTQTRQRD